MTMTPLQAFEYTLKVLDELDAIKGITVTKKPYTAGGDPEAVLEMRKKYENRPGRVNGDNWITAEITYQTAEQAQMIFGMQRQIGWMGITFDKGGMGNSRDWELDWSFEYKPGEIDAGAEEAMEIVEDLILGADDVTEDE